MAVNDPVTLFNNLVDRHSCEVSRPISHCWGLTFCRVLRCLADLVGGEGLEPPNPNGSGFTVRRNCHYAILPSLSKDCPLPSGF